jgi:tripartite-type tricarboxylate transporter receptor subunit TctC
MNQKVMRQLICAALLTIAPMGAAAQENYPTRTIKIVVPVPPGPILDALPRIIADKLAARWGKPVIIENRPGAGLNIGAEAVARAEPDGYTLLATAPPPLVINQSLYPKLGFDPTAFAPVTVLAHMPLVLMVHPKLQVSSVQELIAYAKANPNKLTYASSGSGSTPHLTMELLKTLAGIEIIHVPYKGLGPALTDLLAGHVDMMFDVLGNALTQVESGKLTGLGISSEERVPALPNVPAMAETLPGFRSVTWFAVVAPPKTPPEILAKLSTAIVEAVKLPDVAKRIQGLSITPIGSTPAETAAFISEERERWHKVIVAAGINPE